MDPLLLAVSLCEEVLGHYIFKTGCLTSRTSSVLAATGKSLSSLHKQALYRTMSSTSKSLVQGSTVNVNADQNADFWAALESFPTILSSSLVLI